MVTSAGWQIRFQLFLWKNAAYNYHGNIAASKQTRRDELDCKKVQTVDRNREMRRLSI
jgi:hypothetical protein